MSSLIHQQWFLGITCPHASRITLTSPQPNARQGTVETVQFDEWCILVALLTTNSYSIDTLVRPVVLSQSAGDPISTSSTSLVFHMICSSSTASTPDMVRVVLLSL